METISERIESALKSRGFDYVTTEKGRNFWWIVDGSLAHFTYEHLIVNFGQKGDTEITVLVKETPTAEKGAYSVKEKTFNLATEKMVKILKNAGRAERSMEKLKFFRV